MPGSSLRRVALLRGINNAGKGTRVAMADLRALFTRLGFRDVRTLLNSGNVVFSASRDGFGPRLRKALADELGFSSVLVLVSGEEVSEVVLKNPLAKRVTNPSLLLVVVPEAASDLALLSPLLARRWGDEALAVGERAAYLWCAGGAANSELWPAVEKALAGRCTARNLATMTKLAALAGDAR